MKHAASMTRVSLNNRSSNFRKNYSKLHLIHTTPSWLKISTPSVIIFWKRGASAMHVLLVKRQLPCCEPSRRPIPIRMMQTFLARSMVSDILFTQLDASEAQPLLARKRSGYSEGSLMKILNYMALCFPTHWTRLGPVFMRSVTLTKHV